MRLLSISFLTLLVFVMPSSSVQAQFKSGYLSVERVLMTLPQTAKVDTMLQQYKVDSIDAFLPYIISEFTRKDSLAKIEKNEVVKKTIMNELGQMREQLNNWSSITQQRLQQKQQEWLMPVYEKISQAIDKVVAEEKYTHIFRQESLLKAPPSEDISLKVLAKLGVSVSAQQAAPRPKAAAPKGK